MRLPLSASLLGLLLGATAAAATAAAATAAAATAAAATAAAATAVAAAAPAAEPPPDHRTAITPPLFAALDELARLVDIAYCVGTSGVRRPFTCLGRCGDFPGFELVDTWNTGPLLSDSCGYIALDPAGSRIVVAFRGTYSLANALVDLSSVPQVYVPYPDPANPDPDPDAAPPRWPWRWPCRQSPHPRLQPAHPAGPKCPNCTVHAGFLLAWQHTRPVLLPHLARLRAAHPEFAVHLVGHSLGGAVAALAALELQLHLASPADAKHPGARLVVTTFGEPRVGNAGFVEFLDRAFELDAGAGRGGVEGGTFRRVTHRGDPVPLLPLAEWGYRMHAGEIYIGARALPPAVGDVWMCRGAEDPGCIAGKGGALGGLGELRELGGEVGGEVDGVWEQEGVEMHSPWDVQRRLRLWQMLFAHRDYFWRLGVCVPGGDPVDWGRGEL